MNVSPFVAESTAGVIGTIKSGASSAAMWLGRSVTAAKNCALEGAAKVVAFISPILKGIGNFFKESFSSIRDYAQANRETVTAAGIASVVTLFAYVAGRTLLSRNTSETEEEAAPADNSKDAEGAAPADNSKDTKEADAADNSKDTKEADAADPQDT